MLTIKCMKILGTLQEVSLYTRNIFFTDSMSYWSYYDLGLKS